MQSTIYVAKKTDSNDVWSPPNHPGQFRSIPRQLCALKQPDPTLSRYQISILIIICVMGLTGLTAAQEQALPDTSTQDENFMVSDTLSARYARLDRVQTDFESSPPLTGHISYERSLFPLNHAGQIVYQPPMDDPRLLNVIRLLKKDTSRDPLRAGNGTAPFDYNYNIHGATRNSQMVRGSLERPLLQSVRLGYRFDALAPNFGSISRARQWLACPYRQPSVHGPSAIHPGEFE